MAKKLFIAAIDKNSGKTTTSISLMHLARKKYGRVGYIKPFGGQSVVYRGRKVDKDVALMAKVFDLNDDLPFMSPVVLTPDTTRKAIDGTLDCDGLRQRICSVYAELEKKYDCIIIEGSGHPGVGSVMQISNAQIAGMLAAPVLLVAGGGVGNLLDRLAMIEAYFEKCSATIRGLLVNKLLPEKREKTLSYLRMAAANATYKVIDGFDFQPTLANPTLQRISTILKKPIHGNCREKQRIVYRVQVAAASTHRIVELITEPSLIIVTSSRDELLVTLAHLYQMPEYRHLLVGLVISGGTPVSHLTQQILDKSKIPYIREDQVVSADLYQSINRDVTKITAVDSEKLDLIRHLAEETLDFEAIDRLFG